MPVFFMRLMRDSGTTPVSPSASLCSKIQNKCLDFLKAVRCAGGVSVCASGIFGVMILRNF